MPMIPRTGDSRLKAIECIPEITSVPAIITTHQKYSYMFTHCEQIDSLEQFKQTCKTESDFYVRYTEQSSEYGLDWFEYSEDKVTVPDTEWCLHLIQNYINNQSDNFRFSTDWFKNTIVWDLYK
jgi:hypothetical protein